MKKTISPGLAAVVLAAVVAFLGGAYYLMNRTTSGPPLPPPGLSRNVENPSARIQARSDLPPGIPHLGVPDRRTPGR